METILLIATGTLTTLLAGVFFGYAVSVNGALGRLTDKEYIRAMQSINKVIQNPLFFLSFMGPVVLLPLITILSWDDASTRGVLLLAASAVYIIGSFVVAVAGNVPLNDKLAQVDTTANEASLALARRSFEKPWNNLHTVRTIASIAAGILLFAAFLK